MRVSERTTQTSGQHRSTHIGNMEAGLRVGELRVARLGMSGWRRKIAERVAPRSVESSATRAKAMRAVQLVRGRDALCEDSVFPRVPAQAQARKPCAANLPRASRWLKLRLHTYAPCKPRSMCLAIARRLRARRARCALSCCVALRQAGLPLPSAAPRRASQCTWRVAATAATSRAPSAETTPATSRCC